MTSCSSRPPAPLRCPTASEVLESALALLPRGRAWQSNEGGPVKGYDPAFSPAGFSGAFAVASRKGSILRRFWQAVADVYCFVNQRLCDLRLEFWCATHQETHDLWMQEYGLPDECDPFPDLCTKVAAIGGTRCEYYSEIAARAGWAISCIDKQHVCGTRVGSFYAKVGRAQPGGVQRLPIMTIVVDLHNSPAFVSGPRSKKSQIGSIKSGRGLVCRVPDVVDLTGLECLMSRIVHAEIVIQYGVLS